MTRFLNWLKITLRPHLSKYRWFRKWHGGDWYRLIPTSEEHWPKTPSTPPVNSLTGQD